MKNLKRIFLFAFTFLAGIILVSCGGTTDTPSEIITEGDAASIVAQIKEEVSLPEGLEVDSNLTLPTSFEFAPDAIVDWATSNSAVISKDGVVNRPVYEDGNATVTLKVTITMKFNQNAAGETQYGRVQESYEFVVTVLALPRVPTNEEVANGYLAEVADLSGTHKDDFDLPVVTNGVWSVEGEGLQIVDGVAIVSQTDAEQHATLTVTVTVGDYVGTKSFEITIPALITLHYYNSSEWTKVYVYEWSTDPRVAWPGTEVEVVDGWVHYTPSYDPTGYNYIFNNGSGAQTADIKYETGKNYYYGLVGQGFATVEEMMAHLEANKTVIYLRGDMNSWGTTTPLTENEGTYTITIDLVANHQFKIATEDWSTVNINGAAIKAKDSVNFTTAGDNAKVVNAGTYTFTVEDGKLVSIVKFIDEAEEAQKIMDAVTVPATITNEITLPQAEGLTWAVKEGTAITIAEGVATVTQTEVEQVVVLTATATYGEASVTKDFTVTVLPLVPTDEEIANGYLAEVADLSGEYTEDVALPEVTNGVWSATGLEIVEGVLKVVQTEEVQTATLTITITVGEAVVSKDFTITVPALEVVETVSLHYYNTGKWTSVYVYEWVTGASPRVAWPGTKLTLVDGWAEHVLTYDPTGYNYIFNNGSGSQTPDLAYAGNNYFYGTHEAGFATKEEAVAHYQSTLNTTIDLYVRGDFNSWGTTGGQFKLQEDGTYAVTVTLTKGQTLKVANSGWSKEYAASAIVKLDNVNFSGSGSSNATVVNSGVYKFVYNGTALSAIERIYDDNEEADKILAAIVMPEQCQDTLVLPTAEGLTWAVKEGTAITIVDGVATVTQGDAEQVVVLTATATFRSVTKTQDYTVVVLPAVISDEEQAQIYLDEATDVTGTYKTGFALQAVTNGVWSVTGEGAAIDGDNVVITRTSADQTAVLTLTVTVNEVVLTKDFTLTIPKMGNMLYMTPNSNWKQDNARFAAYFFVGSTTTWADMVDSDGDGIYEVEVPEGSWTNVIFCRMNPNAAENNWNNKWNQTSDLTISGNIGKTYTVKAGTWDKGGGTWA